MSIFCKLKKVNIIVMSWEWLLWVTNFPMQIEISEIIDILTISLGCILVQILVILFFTEQNL